MYIYQFINILGWEKVRGVFPITSNEKRHELFPILPNKI